MIDLNKVSEGVDYNIVPHTQEEEVWAVEIIRGQYEGLGLIFEDIKFDRTYLSFKLSTISLEDGSAVEQDEQLKTYAGDVIEDIIKNAIANGTIDLSESEDGKDSDQ